MCLQCKESDKAKVALEDKKCYKVLELTEDGKLKSPYYDFFYEIGKVYEGATNFDLATYNYFPTWETDSFEEYCKHHRGYVDGNGNKLIIALPFSDGYVDDNGVEIPGYAIGQGFHTCDSLETCMSIFHADLQGILKGTRNLVIAECVIPRGNFYYTGYTSYEICAPCYASTALKIEKIVFNSKKQ